MWQQVHADNRVLVENAYRVLTVYSDRWDSAADFRHWLEEGGAHVFYFHEEGCNLVVGFRQTEEGRWQGILVGIEGNFSIQALGHVFDQAVSFMRENGTRSLFVHLTSPPSPNPFSDALQMAIDYAQARPEVAGISVVPLGRAREYRLTLLESAALRS